MKKIGALVVLACALLSAGLVLSLPAPAAAESRTVRDKPDDLPAWMDLVRLRGDNKEHRMRAVVQVRNLERRGKVEVGFHWHRGLEFGYSYFVRVRHTRDGLKASFRRETLGGDSSPRWTCAENHGRFDYDTRKDRVVLAVPHACLRAFDHIRVVHNWGAYASTYRFVDGDLQYDALGTGRLRRG